jgi:small-conductance mechanosensitive channel
MLTGPVTIDMWIAVVSSVACGVVVALALRAVIRRLQRRAEKTSWRIDDMIVTLVRIVVPPYVLIGGLWVAAISFPLTSAWRGDVSHAGVGAFLIIITIAVARIAGELVQNRAMSHSGTSGSATIFVNITRVIVLALGLLLLLNSLGVAITPLLTALGVGGLAVALALQDTLENLFAGVHILASHQIQPGAFIQLDNGMEGYVEDTNWRNTVIRQTSNNIVVVPNNTLAKSILTNYHRPDQEMSVLVSLGVSYDSDLDYVERVTVEVGREVMREVDGAVPEHEPLVRYTSFGDSSVRFNVILRTSEVTERGTVTHEFIKRLHRRFQAEGIDIPFPTLTLTRADAPSPSSELVPAGTREQGLD